MNYGDAYDVLMGKIDVRALKHNLGLLMKDNREMSEELRILRVQQANREEADAINAYVAELEENFGWTGPSEDYVYMKLLACKRCKDVRVLNDKVWIQCGCGMSGGQYCPDKITAVIGGNCAAVLGIPNTIFDLDFLKPPSEIAKTRHKYHWCTDIWWGEYKGDVQIIRIQSGKGPIPKNWKELKKDLVGDGGSTGYPELVKETEEVLE